MDLTSVPICDKNRLCGLPFQGHDDRGVCIQQPHLLRLGGRRILNGLVYYREPDLHGSRILPDVRIGRWSDHMDIWVSDCSDWGDTWS